MQPLDRSLEPFICTSLLYCRLQAERRWRQVGLTQPSTSFIIRRQLTDNSLTCVQLSAILEHKFTVSSVLNVFFIRSKQKILFGSGFRPTLSIYVRPKLFYELDTVMRQFNTHTFSAVLHKWLTSVTQFLWPIYVCSCCGCLLSPSLSCCCFKHDTSFWVWPEWLFCLKSRLSFCVRFIVQLVLMRRELARFINTGRACEQSAERAKYSQSAERVLIQRPEWWFHSDTTGNTRPSTGSNRQNKERGRGDSPKQSTVLYKLKRVSIDRLSPATKPLHVSLGHIGQCVPG